MMQQKPLENAFHFNDAICPKALQLDQSEVGFFESFFIHAAGDEVKARLIVECFNFLAKFETFIGEAYFAGTFIMHGLLLD